MNPVLLENIIRLGAAVLLGAILGWTLGGVWAPVGRHGVKGRRAGREARRALRETQRAAEQAERDKAERQARSLRWENRRGAVDVATRVADPSEPLPRRSPVAAIPEPRTEPVPLPRGVTR